jgi:lysozyme
MKTSDDGVKFVKRKEGLRLKAYQDIVGKWTIGYGHLINPTVEDYLMDRDISEPLAERILKLDLVDAENCVLKNVKVPLDQCQFDALVDFVFNLGCGALERSTLLILLNQGRYSSAAEQFVRWNKAGGKEVAGLTKRREAERKLFTEGEYV